MMQLVAILLFMLMPVFIPVLAAIVGFLWDKLTGG